MIKKAIRFILEHRGYEVQKRTPPQTGSAVAEVCQAMGVAIVKPTDVEDFARARTALFPKPVTVSASVKTQCHGSLREALQNISMRQYFNATEIGDQFQLEDLSESVGGGRRRMMHTVCRKHFGQTLEGVSVLDLACSSGYYSFLCSLWGASQVLGVDARPEHEEQFHLLSQMLGISESQCRFRRGDVEFGLEQMTESFDLVLCMGIMYHVFDHPRFIKNLYRLTRKVLLLEGACSGRRDNLCKADIEDPLNLRESVHGPVLYPSLPWMVTVLRWAGFKNVEYIGYPPDLPDTGGHAGLWRAMLVAVK